MRYLMRIGLIVQCTIVLLSGGTTFSLAAEQSQDHPPLFISDKYLFQNWTIKDGLPVNSISGITQTEDGYIWIGTADGLVRYDGIEFHVYNTTNFPDIRYNRIKGVARYEGGVLVLNDYGLLSVFKNGIFSDLPAPPEFALASLLFLIQHQDGDIYIVADSSVYRLTDEKEIVLDSTVSHTSLYQMESGDFRWQAYQRTLFSEGKRILELDDQINDAFTDREGNLWLATYSNGIYQLKRNHFTVYSEAEGLKSRNVYPVTESEDGTVWIGTYGGGLATLKNGQLDTGYVFEGKSTQKIYIQSILVRSSDEILASDISGDLFYYSGENIFLRYQDTEFGQINHIFEDSDSTLWLGTSSGLYYQDAGEWISIREPGVENTAIRVIAQAPDASYWVGTAGRGVIYKQGVNTLLLMKEQGLSSNVIRSVCFINVEGEGNYNVLVGTEDQGLSVIPVRSGIVIQSDIISVSEKDGLFDNGIHQIISDGFGRIWMSSNRGIFWVYENELNEFVKGNRTNIISTGYTEKDGLKNREANGGMQPAGMKARDGTLWFPTQDGVVMVDPVSIQRNLISPKVNIERIQSLTNEYHFPEGTIDLEIDDRDVTFEFSALSFVDPERNKYQFRLFGYEEEWTELNRKEPVRYTNLPPGEYTFKVIASNSDGIWNQTGDIAVINVPSHFYEELWFYLLLIGLVLLQVIVVFMIIRSKASHQLEIKEAEMEELKHERSQLESKLQNQKQIKRSLLFNLKKELREPVVELRRQMEEGKESLERIVDRESHKMLSKVDQLLLLSEIEVEGISINPSLENMVDVLKTSIGLHKAEANENDPVIELTTNSDRVSIYLDLKLAIIIFRNLIKNACEHLGVTRIRIQIVEESSMCTIKIIDNGEALSHSTLHMVFKLFKEKKQSTDQRHELGIDLPLVARLVDLHKASIVVHSVPEKGNTFMISFKKGSLHFDESVLNQKTEIIL